MENIMFKNVLKSITAILLVIGVAACSSSTPEEKALETKTEKLEAAVENIPDWYLEQPTEDFAVFSSGRAESADMQFAVNIARLQAKHQLADRINGMLSGKIKAFTTELGDPTSDEGSELITTREEVASNVIANVSVGGYKVKETVVQAYRGRYVAYTLLEYPVGKANKILMGKLRKTRSLYGRIRATKAFQELERDVAKAEGNDTAGDGTPSMKELERVERELETKVVPYRPAMKPSN